MGIENKYVWAVGTTYDAAGLAQEHTVTDPKDGSVKQKYYTYPRDYKEVVKAGDPISVNVDQLEYRLDKENRKWNERDGDVSKLFISESTVELAVCSKRGLCDYDTGMCDCFSGYSGIRCDDQNAIAYSY